MRTSAMEMKCNLYPNYESVTEANKRCFPKGIICTETSAEVPLQCLMDHTTQRLCLSLNEVLQSLTTDRIKYLRLISKCCHSQYKQTFGNADQSDTHMVITTIVPIQLLSDHEKPVLIWQNPRPSSPRYCRPLRLEMGHETPELARSIAQNVRTQIENLTSTIIEAAEEELVVRHKLMMTMGDGKMVNALTDTKSAMRCFICQATSKDFNRIKFCK